MVALGVVLLYDQAYSAYFTMLTHASLPQEIVQCTAFGCIGLGGFILFVGFFGCCGALQDSKCMLGTVRRKLHYVLTCIHYMLVTEFERCWETLFVRFIHLL